MAFLETMEVTDDIDEEKILEQIDLYRARRKEEVDREVERVSCYQ